MHKLNTYDKAGLSLLRNKQLLAATTHVDIKPYVDLALNELSDDDVVVSFKVDGQFLGFNKHGAIPVYTTDTDSPVTRNVKPDERGFSLKFLQAIEKVRSDYYLNRPADSQNELFLEGSIPPVALIGGSKYLAIPGGVHVVHGGSGVGKTPFAHALGCAISENFEDNATYAVVRSNEPFVGYQTDLVTSLRMVVLGLLHHRVVVWDSIKDFLSDDSSAAMSGGLARSVLTLISNLSTIASTLGCALVIPFNPSSKKNEAVETIEEAILSSATATYRSDDSVNWDASYRLGEGLPRVDVTLTFSESEDMLGNLSFDDYSSPLVAAKSSTISSSSNFRPTKQALQSYLSLGAK